MIGLIITSYNSYGLILLHRILHFKKHLYLAVHINAYSNIMRIYIKIETIAFLLYIRKKSNDNKHILMHYVIMQLVMYTLWYTTVIYSYHKTAAIQIQKKFFFFKFFFYNVLSIINALWFILYFAHFVFITCFFFLRKRERRRRRVWKAKAMFNTQNPYFKF